MEQSSRHCCHGFWLAIISSPKFNLSNFCVNFWFFSSIYSLLCYHCLLCSLFLRIFYVFYRCCLRVLPLLINEWIHSRRISVDLTSNNNLRKQLSTTYWSDAVWDLLTGHIRRRRNTMLANTYFSSIQLRDHRPRPSCGADPGIWERGGGATFSSPAPLPLPLPSSSLPSHLPFPPLPSR